MAISPNHISPTNSVDEAYPEKGRPATGILAPDGSYRLTTFDANDGALLGRHRVTIEARRITPTMISAGDDPESAGAHGPPKVEWLLPEKYAGRDSSPLTAEVKHGDNTIDYDLPAAKNPTISAI